MPELRSRSLPGAADGSYQKGLFRENPGAGNLSDYAVRRIAASENRKPIIFTKGWLRRYTSERRRRKRP